MSLDESIIERQGEIMRRENAENNKFFKMTELIQFFTK